MRWNLELVSDPLHLIGRCEGRVPSRKVLASALRAGNGDELSRPTLSSGTPTSLLTTPLEWLN
jgi:hypothetical protein